jgi:hypothetical protein
MKIRSRVRGKLLKFQNRIVNLLRTCNRKCIDISYIGNHL